MPQPTRILALVAFLALSACSLAPEAPAMVPVVQGAPAQRCTIAWLPQRVRRHQAAIEAASLRHGVDANLIAIVVLVESGGDPRAKSPSGALGLMQLMPKTAAGIAKRRGFRGHRQRQLYRPDYNLDLGTWYLAQQLKNHGRGISVYDVALAAAAYNAGPGRLRRHLRSGKALPAETRRYQRLVAGMWQERRLPMSATLQAWRDRRV
jgi:soluble lytic murein transglycosylase-like protein